MNLGETIRALRKERVIKLKELARHAGISANALVNIEKDRSFPSQNTFRKICSGIGVSTGFVLFSTLTEDDVPPQKREVFRLLVTFINENMFKKEMKNE